MSNLSDFLGGSGGGGDPQATFQASANVSANDLVALMNNGTIKPVNSDNVTIDFGAEQYVNGPYASQQSANGKQSKAFYDPAQDKWILLFLLQNADMYIMTASVSGSTVTIQANGGSTYEYYSSTRGFDACWDSASGQVVVTTIQTNDYATLSSIYWSGTNNRYQRTASTTWAGASHQGDAAFIAENGDGTGIAIHNYSSTSGRCVAWTNAANANPPSVTNGGGNDVLSTYPTVSTSKWGVLWNIADKTYACMYHTHINGDTRFRIITDSGTSVSGGGAINPFMQGFAAGLSTFAYNPNTKTAVIGIVQQTNNAYWKTFTFNGQTPSTPANLGSVPLGNQYTAITYSSYQDKFVAFCQSNSPASTFEIATFDVDSTGVCQNVNRDSDTFSHPNTGSTLFEFPSISASEGSNDKIFVFGNNNADNNEYVIAGSPPYLDTNVDKYFGQATEAITSGSTGAVSIINRSVDLLGNTFQKGQKLFANPSGSALATSGTYRVGYATDGDTVLVTGEPS
ncbi:hypothetical protein CRP2_gp52 [Roseobacter phage CRP-2]|nr:hypothetical protein CRP2_gp52 [Roseobacter phage CRP-2]